MMLDRGMPLFEEGSYPRTPLLSRGDTFLHEETLRNKFGAPAPRGKGGGGMSAKQYGGGDA